MKKTCCMFLTMILILLVSVSMAEVNKAFTFQDIPWGTKAKNITICSKYDDDVYNPSPVGAEVCGLDLPLDAKSLYINRGKFGYTSVNIAGFEDCSFEMYFVRTCTGNGLCSDDDAVLYGATIKLYESDVPEALRTPSLWEDFVTKLITAYGPADKIVSNGYADKEYLVWKGQQETWLIYNLGRHTLTYFCANGTNDLFCEGQAWLDSQVSEAQITWNADMTGL